MFLPGELPFRGSIEGGYAGMARFISQHPNPWGWNPLQYCGLPAQFLYVPALPYLTALLVRVAPWLTPDYGYRLIAAVATCLGPVTVFFFALQFTRSRRWALAAAVVYSLFSPSYGLFPAVEKDRGLVQLPWRAQVLAKYGEGPHNFGLTLLPLALAALWRAGRERSYPTWFFAAVVLAAIPLSNWVAAFALALSCLLLLLAATLLDPEFRAWRAFAAAGLAYLLACFWLTPGFVRTIAFNWPSDSFGYHLGQTQRWLLAGMIAGVALIGVAFRLLRGSFYFCLVTMGAFAFGWIATGYYVFGTDTVPESRRYALEFELFLALAAVEAVRITLRSKNPTVRLCVYGCAGALLLAGLPQLWAYLTQGGERWRPRPPETTVEYRLARWLADHHPQGRVFASGGLRFRLNSWFDLPQTGGGFETGLRNRAPIDLAYRVRTGSDRAEMLRDLRTLGVEYLVVHGPRSQEYYRDFHHLERLEGLPIAYREDDDTIYSLPLPPLVRFLPDEQPLQARWASPTTLEIDGPPAPGRTISVRVNADPGWRTASDIQIETDAVGYIVLRANAAGPVHIELRYQGTTEQRIMAAVSAAAWIGALAALFISKRDQRIHL